MKILADSSRYAFVWNQLSLKTFSKKKAFQYDAYCPLLWFWGEERMWFHFLSGPMFFPMEVSSQGGGGVSGTTPTVNRITDRHLWKHYLPTTTVAIGKNVFWSQIMIRWKWPELRQKHINSFNRLPSIPLFSYIFQSFVTYPMGEQ